MRPANLSNQGHATPVSLDGRPFVAEDELVVVWVVTGEGV